MSAHKESIAYHKEVKVNGRTVLIGVRSEDDIEAVEQLLSVAEFGSAISVACHETGDVDMLGEAFAKAFKSARQKTEGKK